MDNFSLTEMLAEQQIQNNINDSHSFTTILFSGNSVVKQCKKCGQLWVSDKYNTIHYYNLGVEVFKLLPCQTK